MSVNGLISKGTEYAASIAASTDFFSSDITPTEARSTFRLTVQLATAAKLILTSDDGHTGGKNHTLNNDTDLAAGNLYTFVFGVDSAYSYNLQHDHAAPVVVDYCLLDEVTRGAI